MPKKLYWWNVSTGEGNKPFRKTILTQTFAMYGIVSHSQYSQYFSLCLCFVFLTLIILIMPYL